jgi:hypothetical protein
VRGARTSRSGLGALAACALLVSACSSDPKPVYQDAPEPQAVVSEYDASLEPSAAVLPLVPEAATTLEVTDFDQLRLVLGLGSLDGTSSPADLARFRRDAPRTATLTLGRLRPFEERLRADFGIGQDDVVWEASYAGGATGWVLKFNDKVPTASLQRAVRAGVGPLRGAVVDPARHLVSSAELPTLDASWGAVDGMLGLVGREAISTYVERACLPFDTVFGDGMEDQLADAPAAALRALDELDAYSVALGAELATVQLGPERSDAFDRVRLAEVMPPTEPDFDVVMSRGVADPSTGRLGYVLGDPVAAAELTRSRTLPFAVCRGGF